MAEKPNSDTHKFQQHFTFLDQRIGLANRRVLDFGCGVGNFLEIASRGGVAEAMGVEINDRAREVALSKGFRVEKTIDQYNKSEFALVYMNDVIEHLRNPVASLRGIRRVLAQNGMLFIVTMNLNGLKARLLKKKWDLINDPTHFYFFSPISLLRMLREGGYDQVSEERFVVHFSLHGLMRRILQRGLVRVGLDTSLKMLAR